MSSLQRGVKRKPIEASNSAPSSSSASTLPTSSSARNLFTGTNLLSNTGNNQPVRKKQKTLSGPKSETKKTNNKASASDEEDPLFTVDSEDEDDPLQPNLKVNYVVNIKNPIPITTMKKVVSANNSSSNGVMKKKTITIAPLKSKPTLPANFEQDRWNSLRESVQAVFNKRESNISREELYKQVQDLCMHKMDQSLYENLKIECENHIKQVIENFYGQSTDLFSFLSTVTKMWDEFVEQMLTIRSIFLFLDRTYVIQFAGVRSLWDLGLQIFRANLTDSLELETKIISGTLQLIEKERRGDSIHRITVKKILKMLMQLQIYEDSFEKVFIDKTKQFYEEESKILIEKLNVPEYIHHIEERMKQENERIVYYLSTQTKRPLLSTIEKQLIENHCEDMIQKGFEDLVIHHRLEELSKMYELFSIVSQLNLIADAFNSFIKKHGSAIVKDEERDKTMVEDLLKFKDKIDEIQEKSFNNNQTFKYSIKSAFEYFLNTRQNTPAELIAKFIDTKLKLGNKGMAEDELERTLDNALSLFRYIDGKDVFEAFYKKDLAKRLLLDRSASTDLEKVMISKLKTECGASFTSKLEGMFKDVDISRDLMQQFKMSKEYKEIKDIDLNVTVIATGFWPSYTPEPAVLPKEVEMVQEVFKKFYLDKHSGRVLKWQNSLGHCTLKAHFPKGTKELQVSLFQAVVLMLFNNSEQLSYKEIKELSGIEVKELKRTLQSVAVAKTKVLQKTPKSKEVNDDDVFHYNAEFEHSLVRIRINAVQIEETKEEQDTTNEKVLADRKYAIDAAVVRIMKARKTLSHQLLMTEVLGQLKFPTKAVDIKKRIEDLISREYLERDTSSSGSETNCIYKYLA